ncbi:hypothetical protein [Hymenobacter rubripertinctus]|uniref:DUF5007 domain-containing protein n=1 Tax=Hymenobacter rubripertinctus TaxID=2029981 RepID=A0A418R283_9BACT|nr:hypothetical protein [Hymenobacter rubripertinctus]RIY11547.1 hypothetical protein D0T11_06990 [Hymenobacter rubripertinctus]
MPRYLLLLPALAALLLTACEPALQPGPRVEFVGSTRFNTTDRRLTTPGDTVANRVYGEADGSALARLQITVDYEPVPEPIIYDPIKTPDKRTFTYLDMAIPDAGKEQFAFQSVQPTRTTAGQEVWHYKFTDAEGLTGVRSLRLRLGRTDSAAAYHSYTVTVQAPGDKRRRFLALREGLTLPDFSVIDLPQNRPLIDLVYVPQTGTAAPTFATATDAVLGLLWPNARATLIRNTPLTSVEFAAAGTTAALTTAFNNGTSFAPRPTSTGALKEGQVMAFLTPGDKYGLLLVQTIVSTGIRSVVVQVRISK